MKRPISRPMTGSKREYGAGGLTRFVNAPVTEPTSRERAALAVDHPAVVDGATIFPSRVFNAGERDRVLISGINNAKIGKLVTKGEWAGFPIYLLSLEERATCPRSCAVWRECYGNGMPMAVRFRYNPELMMSLDGELAGLSLRHPGGFVVRLHVLGDFPDLNYLRHWAEWSDEFEALHVWGYTAHPRDGLIGGKISLMNELRPERWLVRFSVAPGDAVEPMQASAIWFKPHTTSVDADTLVCPQEVGKTATCGTCGLCWNPAAAHLRILFLGHGRLGQAAAIPSAPREVTYRPAPTLLDSDAEAEAIREFIARNGVARMPVARAGR